MRSADIVRRGLKLAMLPYAALAREAWPGVMILTYHQVGGGDTRQLDLPAELFEAQMRYVARHHRVVPLDEIVPIAREGRRLPDDCVVLTFDDGYADVYHHAFPVLARYDLPATIYLSTRFIDEQQPFRFGAHERRPRGAPLRWEQIQEMQRSGLITIGAHTHSHADLTRLPEERVAVELAQANHLIAARVGTAPAHFAYPWGRSSVAARGVVDRLYRTAAGGTPRKNRYGAIDLGSLRRIPVQRSDGMYFFRLKLSGWSIPTPSTLVPQ